MCSDGVVGCPSVRLSIRQSVYIGLLLDCRVVIVGFVGWLFLVLFFKYLSFFVGWLVIILLADDY